MKVVYISRSAIPSRLASSIHVMKMCHSFAQNGHEVTLIIPDITLNDINKKTDIFKFYGVEKKFDVLRVPWIPIKGKSYIYGMMAALRARKINPDIIYARDIVSCYFSMLLRLAYVCECHTVDYYGRILDNYIFKKVISSRKLSKLVVITKYLHDLILRKYNSIPEEKIIIAPDAADDPQVMNMGEICRKDKINVGYVGHLYEGRGIKLIHSLAEHCQWADFHIVGGLDEDIEFWINKSKDIQNLKFYGFVPPSETDKYRKSFDVLIAPYEAKVSVFGGRGDTSQWMSPMKIFEYMASGKAIICSDLPVLREVLVPGETALLCDPEDIQQWVKALECLRDDEKLRNVMGQRAKEHFLQKYTWNARANNILRNVQLN